MNSGIEIIDVTQPSEFKKIFDEHYVALCLFAERYLGSPEDAADTAQEAFLKLWQQRRNFNNRNALKSFLYTTARNTSLNRLEHLKVKGKYHKWFSAQNNEHFFHDHVIEQECFRMIWEAIHALPNQTRNVMLLALEGKDHGEIAADLEMAKGTVHTHKKIAYKRLRESLKDIFPLCFMLLFLPHLPPFPVLYT